MRSDLVNRYMALENSTQARGTVSGQAPWSSPVQSFIPLPKCPNCLASPGSLCELQPAIAQLQSSPPHLTPHCLTFPFVSLTINYSTTLSQLGFPAMEGKHPACMAIRVTYANSHTGPSECHGAECPGFSLSQAGGLVWEEGRMDTRTRAFSSPS